MRYLLSVVKPQFLTHEFDRTLERVKILIFQPMLNLTVELANPSNIVVETHKQIPETSQVSRFNATELSTIAKPNLL